MRTFLVFTVALLLGLIIQATLIHTIVPAAVAPDFLAILVLFLSLRFRHSWGVAGAFAIGLAGDFASGRFVGPFAAGGVVSFLVCMSFASHVYAERGFSLAFLGFLSSVSKNLAALLVLAMYVKSDAFTIQIATLLVGEGLITAALTPLVVPFLEWGHAPANATGSFRVPREVKRSFS